MKNFKLILVAMVVIAAVTMVSCKETKEETNTETKVETTAKQGKEYTSAYVCPMHCENSGSEKAGNCGACGMGLAKNEDHNANGHKHE